MQPDQVCMVYAFVKTGVHVGLAGGGSGASLIQWWL